MLNWLYRRQVVVTVKTLDLTNGRQKWTKNYKDQLVDVTLELSQLQEQTKLNSKEQAESIAETELLRSRLDDYAKRLIVQEEEFLAEIAELKKERAASKSTNLPSPKPPKRPVTKRPYTSAQKLSNQEEEARRHLHKSGWRPPREEYEYTSSEDEVYSDIMQSNTSRPFYRPADDYERVEEGRGRESASLDASGPSMKWLSSWPKYDLHSPKSVGGRRAIVQERERKAINPRQSRNRGSQIELHGDVPVVHGRPETKDAQVYDPSPYPGHRSTLSLDDPNLKNDFANLPASKDTRWEQVYIDGDMNYVSRDSKPETEAQQPDSVQGLLNSDSLNRPRSRLGDSVADLRMQHSSVSSDSEERERKRYVQAYRKREIEQRESQPSPISSLASRKDNDVRRNKEKSRGYGWPAGPPVTATLTTKKLVPNTGFRNAIARRLKEL
jgi:hypothetical protein